MSTMNRRVATLFAAWMAALVFAAPAVADHAADSPDNTWIDRYHASIEHRLFGTSLWFDRFFVDDAIQEELDPDSSLRWTNEFRWDQKDSFEYRFRVRARLRLPRLQGRLRLIISGENQGDPTGIRPEDPGNPGLDVGSVNRKASTELAYDLYRSGNTLVSPGVGVLVRTRPRAFVRTRFLHIRELAYSVIGRLAVIPFWQTRDGFGVSNLLEFDRQLDLLTLLRWSNSATISEDTVGWEWGSEIAVLRKLSPVSAITFAANASGTTRPVATVQNYRVYVTYRRNFLRPWLYYELEPDVNWPREVGGGRDTVLGGTVRLEVNFTGIERHRTSR
ncbi:MAG: hypothetical protein AB1346_01260 [Thermodesulfobacteriota bacterium]